MLPDPGQWPADGVHDRRIEDLLRERATSTPDRTAVVDADSGNQWTFAEFDRRVSARAEQIGRRCSSGVGRLGVLLDPGVAFAEVAFAAWRLGATLVPFDVHLDEGTLTEQVERTAIDALVCDSGTAATADAAAPVEVDVVSADEPLGESSVSRDSESTGSPRTGDAPPGSISIVMFTSGTTGRSKAVQLTTTNLVASANASADRLGVDSDDRWLVCLPTYHMGGLAPLVRSTLYGTTTVLQPDFDPQETAATMEAHAVTCVSLVPTMLKRLLDAGWSPSDELRFVLLGGGPASTTLLERCTERDVPVCPTYGTTETASQVATALPETAFSDPGTVGRPLAGITVSIRDENDDPCDSGVPGEVVVGGSTVSPGYLDDEATAVAFDESGFHTGDFGYVDDDGKLWIEGRVDDLILTGGENVVPDRVVDALVTHGSVEDAFVCGIADDEWGRRVAALVQPADSTLTVEDVLTYSRKRLAAYEVPKTVRLVSELPRTPSGTVDRERARSMLGDAS